MIKLVQLQNQATYVVLLRIPRTGVSFFSWNLDTEVAYHVPTDPARIPSS